MYNENHIDRSLKLKRRSTRHVSEVTAIASEYGNSAKIIVPRSWLRKRVLHSFILILFQNILRSEEKMSSEALLSNITIPLLLVDPDTRYQDQDHNDNRDRREWVSIWNEVPW
jgi:putative transposon-encoded protein